MRFIMVIKVFHLAQPDLPVLEVPRHWNTADQNRLNLAKGISVWPPRLRIA